MSRARSIAVAVLLASSAAILAASLRDFPGSAFVLALAVCASPVALIVLGAARGGRVGRLGGALVALFLLLAGGLVAVLALSTEVGRAVWIAGLPAASFVLVVAVAVGALVLVVAAYAWTFGDFGPSAADLARLRRSVGAGEAGEEL